MRTRFSTNEGTLNLTQRQIQVLTATIVARQEFAAKLGMQYAGNRNIYTALGYPTVLSYADYLGKYLRQDIAKAVIDRPVTASWRGSIELIESSISEDTEFEEAWDNLEEELKIKSKLARVDRLTGIGRYGILFLGLDDAATIEDLSKPVKSGKRNLLYIKPLGEASALIDTYENNPNNVRFGLPLHYTVQLADVATDTSVSARVHASRVIHITDGALESEVFGLPRLQAIFNRLADLEKIVGGDAEMFWRGARPGYAGKTAEGYTMGAAQEKEFLKQIDEYENDLRRILIAEGIDLKELAQQIADPSKHVDVVLICISAVTGIPKRILSGSERGELSSAQDSEEWKDYVQARRDDFNEPNIIKPFVKACIQYGILPKPKSQKYTVKWSDIYAPSEKAQVELGKGRANAIREYTHNPLAQTMIPPDAFVEFCLGLSKEQKTLIRAMRNTMLSEEELNEIVLEQLEPPEPTQPLPTGQSLKVLPAKSGTKPRRTK